MGLLADITAIIKPYISLFTLAVIAVADYIWEDKYFICPCVNDDLRTAYSLAFVLSPATYLFLATSNFRALCRTCQNCTATFCKSLGGLLRPFVLAGAWMTYSVLDPRFSDCIQKEYNRAKDRNCTEEDRSEGKRRASVALTILSLSLLALIIAGLVGCCRGCRWCKKVLCSDCCKKCLFENLTQEKKLTGHTLILLEEEDLLEDIILMNLDDSDFKKLENKLTMGQFRILKKHCRELKDAEQQRSRESSERPGTLTASINLNPGDEQQAEQQSERESSEGPDTSPSTNAASNDFDRQARQQSAEESNGEPDTSARDDFDTSVKTPFSQRLGIKQSKNEEEIPLLSLPSTNYSNLGNRIYSSDFLH